MAEVVPGFSKTLVYMGTTGITAVFFAKMDVLGQRFGELSGQLGRLVVQVGEVHGAAIRPQEIRDLSDKVQELQGVVNELKHAPKVDPEHFHQLVDLLRKEVKNNDELPKKMGNYEVYALEAAGLLALTYVYMYMKGISTSDVVNGTKRGIASFLSSISKRLGLTSATLSGKLIDIIEQIENQGKENEHRDTASEIERVPTGSETLKLDSEAEYLSFLYKLVIGEGSGLVDDDCLQRAFDYLNQNRVAARGFISKRYSNMRKRWLKDFEKRCFEESMDSSAFYLHQYYDE